MPGTTTQEVFKLSDCFYQFSKAVEAIIDNRLTELEPDERNLLFDYQVALLRISGEINMIGTTLVFEDAGSTLHQLDAITAEVNKTVEKLQAVHKVIEIASKLVLIGNAILAKDVKAIVSTVGETGKLLGIDFHIEPS